MNITYIKDNYWLGMHISFSHEVIRNLVRHVAPIIHGVNLNTSPSIDKVYALLVRAVSVKGEAAHDILSILHKHEFEGAGDIYFDSTVVARHLTAFLENNSHGVLLDLNRLELGPDALGYYLGLLQDYHPVFRVQSVLLDLEAELKKMLDVHRGYLIEYYCGHHLDPYHVERFLKRFACLHIGLGTPEDKQEFGIAEGVLLHRIWVQYWQRLGKISIPVLCFERVKRVLEQRFSFLETLSCSQFLILCARNPIMSNVAFLTFCQSEVLLFQMNDYSGYVSEGIIEEFALIEGIQLPDEFEICISDSDIMNAKKMHDHMSLTVEERRAFLIEHPPYLLEKRLQQVVDVPSVYVRRLLETVYHH